MPPEETRELHPALRAEGLDTILLVSPTSPPRRMREAARLSSGFLYVVSRAGITGARAGLPRDLPETVRRARAAAGGRRGGGAAGGRREDGMPAEPLPVAVGFGIATPEAAREAARIADGVVVGSALVQAAEAGALDREAAVERLARRLVAACRRGPGAADPGATDPGATE